MNLKMWLSIIAATFAVLAAEFDSCTFRHADNACLIGAKRKKNARKKEGRHTYDF